MSTSPALPLPTRSAIVLIALLQGLMLYAVQKGADAGLFHDLGHRVQWYAWVLSIPTAVALTLVQLGDRRLWLHAVAGSALVLALSAWVGWTVTGASGLETAPVLTPFSFSLAIAVFVSLPWWQHRLDHGSWRAPYADLFERAWQNGLTLALAVAFTGLTWMLLWLCAALFALVDIQFFRQLFREAAFVALTTGALFGFGVLIGRTQHRAIQMTRQVLFAVGRGLLPLLAVIALLFVVTLPFTGLEPLWRTRSAASLLLTLVLLLVTFTNAVYQHDSAQAPYPRWLCRVVDASLLTLPVYAALALYAMGLRIAQYGFTPDRVWALLIALLVAGYALGYALAALRRQGRWLQTLEPVNRWMCWAVLACALLGNSPLLDPARISANSQLARLQAQAPEISGDDAMTLRFGLGRHGVDALKAMQQDPRWANDDRAAKMLADVLARDTRWGRDYQRDDLDGGLRGVAALQQQIATPKDQPAPEGWWQALNARELGDACLQPGADCVAVTRDLNQDGSNEVLLCDLSAYRGPACHLHGVENARWRHLGLVSFPDKDNRDGNEAANAALRAGQLTLQPARWPRLSLGDGAPSTITESPENP